MEIRLTGINLPIFEGESHFSPGYRGLAVPSTYDYITISPCKMALTKGCCIIGTAGRAGKICQIFT